MGENEKARQDLHQALKLNPKDRDSVLLLEKMRKHSS
jgi:hypothetical protein